MNRGIWVYMGVCWYMDTEQGQSSPMCVGS